MQTNKQSRRTWLWLILLGIPVVPLMNAMAQEAAQANKEAPAIEAKPSIDVKPANDAKAEIKAKPFTDNVRRGLVYLIEQQNDNGGFGQGGGWRQAAEGKGRVEGKDVKDPPDLGSTCIAALALIRAGNTPQEGEYSKQLARAATFICERVEKSDADSLYVTDVRDTQLQSKIGPYVDTFLAGLVLSELKGKMPADGSDKKLVAALDKTVKKIEKNQKADGTFAGNHGWASVLSQGLCSKFINRAAQSNVAVKNEVLDRDFQQTVATADKPAKDSKAAARTEVAAAEPAARSSAASASRTAGPTPDPARTAAAGGTDAGVKLYKNSSDASRLNDRGNTAAILERRAKSILASGSATDGEKAKAQEDLKKVAEIKDAQQAAVADLVRQLDDKQFIAGFGNNGGEEFLSYMNISEMLVVSGGEKWKSWDKSISENLNRIQNQDGSWSGHHCITGRTFCTSTALLTLLADRAPVPLAAKLQEPQNTPSKPDASAK